MRVRGRKRDKLKQLERERDREKVRKSRIDLQKRDKLRNKQKTWRGVVDNLMKTKLLPTSIEQFRKIIKLDRYLYNGILMYI